MRRLGKVPILRTEEGRFAFLERKGGLFFYVAGEEITVSGKAAEVARLVSRSRNVDGKALAALTKDVSARGVFFYVDSDVKEGSPIEFTLTLPPEITLTESIKVRCMGRVVRVEKSISAGHLGVGCAIDQYDFLPN